MKHLGQQSYDVAKAAAPEPTTAQEEAAWRAAERAERALFKVAPFNAAEGTVSLTMRHADGEPSKLTVVLGFEVELDQDGMDEFDAAALACVLDEIGKRGMG